VAGENQQHHLALLNGPGDFAWKRTAGPNVAWRDPASDRRPFESGADSVRYLPVLGRVGKENVMRHEENESACFYSRLDEHATEFMPRPMNLASFSPRQGKWPQKNGMPATRLLCPGN
jgi:hypothetical protein